ncbi:MAG: hypothetical protein CMO66_05145 [Verrucomicrobiales bacterium]|nr:hypothetical protein [Verrucomicrobiales bacterium]
MWICIRFFNNQPHLARPRKPASLPAKNVPKRWKTPLNCDKLWAVSIGSQKNSGFTLIELLVVIAIIGILASILIPTLSAAKQKANASKSQSDKKQLQAAWQMYTDDNSDVMVLNIAHKTETWCKHNLSSDPRLDSRVDEQTFLTGSLSDYISGQQAMFRNPGDYNTFNFKGEQKAAVRSVALNNKLNGIGDGSIEHLSKVAWPSETVVFLDVQTSSFGEVIGSDKPGFSLNFDTPGDYNGNRCSMSFVDGHAEIMRWEPGSREIGFKGLGVPEMQVIQNAAADRN